LTLLASGGRFRQGEAAGLLAEGKGHSNGIVDLALVAGRLVSVGLDDTLRVADAASMAFSAEVRRAWDEVLRCSEHGMRCMG
jgi:hypothetical protein